MIFFVALFGVSDRDLISFDVFLSLDSPPNKKQTEGGFYFGELHASATSHGELLGIPGRFH